MTNFEWITENADKMAEFLDQIVNDCEDCPAYDICTKNVNEICKNRLKELLLSEVEE